MQDESRYGEFEALVEAFDGQTHWFDQGYHATFRFWLAKSKVQRTHPYRYELVLHDPNGNRIMGYDNAHPVRWKSGQFTQQSKSPDHFHRDRSDKGRPYVFVSLTQLLEDFYQRAEKILTALNVSTTVRDAKPTEENNDEH